MLIFLQVSFWMDNHCHLFLHIIFLSDICNRAGTAIDNQFWVGDKLATHSTFHWPQTHKPMSQEWELWQQGLAQGMNMG